MSNMLECDPQDHKEKLQAPYRSNFQKGNDHLQWGFYPIHKTCKSWEMTLSSSMAMFSVMRDIRDAKMVQWKEDELLFTCMPHANIQINWL